ncbi:MAG TPA: DNA-binding protein [Pseudorhodoferax sp.]|jgi:hypothetical protein|nr:DNA-binding protein [Pseudorhodoferax sp.]
MPGPETTFEQVATAAQGLVDQGLPVGVDSLRAALGDVSTLSIHKHLAAWRASQPAPAQAADPAIPASIATALGAWARQLAEDAAAQVRGNLAQTQGDLASLLQQSEQAQAERGALDTDLAQARALLAERDASIERLTVELRHARTIASDALVGKAKDQLAIDGKDAQIAELRHEIERHLAGSAAASDARLAAQMELVGAVTARDNFAAEIAELRAQLDDARRTAASV